MRTGLLLVLAISGCSSSMVAPPEPKNPDAPNVLLISLDTLRRDHLASYGYPKDTAPTLTRISEQGAQFDHAYSMAPATDGSHATLFTGRYMSEHGKFSHMQRLARSELTIAEHFKDNGYRTFGFASSVKFIKKSGFGQGFDQYARNSGKKNRRSRWVVNQMINEVAKPGGPWFGFLHLFDPHAPYAPPRLWRALWHPLSRLIHPAKTTTFLRKKRRKRGSATERQVKLLNGLYDGEVSFMDMHMAQILAVAKADKTRDTLIVITADHGEAFNEHGYLGHDRFLYEEIMQVPLLFWWPNKIPAGTRIDTPVPAVDVFPTIAQLAGLSIPEQVTGKSHAAALLGQPAAPNPEGVVLMQATKRWALAMNTPTGRFKLTRRMANGKERLTRLDEDPMGLVDVKDDYPLIRKVLYDKLQGFNLVDAKGRSLEREDFDEDELNALRAIGYIE